MYVNIELTLLAKDPNGILEHLLLEYSSVQTQTTTKRISQSGEMKYTQKNAQKQLPRELHHNMPSRQLFEENDHITQIPVSREGLDIHSPDNDIRYLGKNSQHISIWLMMRMI